MGWMDGFINSRRFRPDSVGWMEPVGGRRSNGCPFCFFTPGTILAVGQGGGGREGGGGAGKKEAHPPHPAARMLIPGIGRCGIHSRSIKVEFMIRAAWW